MALEYTILSFTVQTTLVLVKPDGVRRGLIGEVISRIEQQKLRIDAMRLLTIDKELAAQHYEEHTSKPFFDELISFITSGPVVAMAVTGEEAIAVVRELLGATDPKKASPGTIRGDFGLDVTENIAHGSDGQESAERELALYFPEQ